MEKLYILDAVNYIFRSYYAMGPMTNEKGESTHALYGFIRSIQKLRKDFSPKYFVAVFDGPENKKKRQEIYSEYKGHRQKAPPDLYVQIQRALEYCQMEGIPTLMIPGVEADDTMASIAVWASSQMDVFLCTSDKDLYQMVSPHVFVLQAHKDNCLIDEAGVEKLFGVKPSQIVDYLSLVGDASDHVPGVEGFGPKTVADLLQKKKTLENILEHPEEISGKKGQILFEQRDNALMSKKLVQLQLDVEFPTEKEFFLLKPPQIENLKQFFQEMKFLKFLEELAPSGEAIKETRYHLVEDSKKLEQLISKLLQEKEIALDTETTDIRPLKASLVGIGLGVVPGEAWYIPFNGALSKEIIFSELKKLFQKKEISFYGHNIKYDLHVLFKQGFFLENISFDTILASYVLAPQSRQHNLDRLALEKLGIVKIPFESLLEDKKHQKTLQDVPIEKVSTYCCEDVDCTCRLKIIFEKELLEKDLEKVFREIEMPLLPVLMRMEQRGIYVEVEALKKLSVEFSRQLHILEREIFEEVGSEFNLNSPKQMSAILYHKLKLPLPRKKTSEFSTAAPILEKLAFDYPIVKTILQYRGLQKLLSTYIDTLPEQVNSETQRIHATFNQSVTATGRLSCQDPNLQNIPVRSAEGQKIRSCFRPQKQGWSYLSADYSQIELRLLAHFSEDESLLHAFRTKQDIHTYTASLIYHVPLEAVESSMRQAAKAVNFGILYGQGPFGLSEQLHISTQEAAAFIHTYFERYPGVQKYLEESKKRAEELGFATTLTGRKRFIPDLQSKNPQVKAAAQRLAVNSPLQGTSADLIKLAMIEIDRVLQKEKLKGFLILQIHDELLFEIPDEEIGRFQEIVKEKMEHIFSLKVPLEVDLEVGKNWGEC